MDLLVLAKEPRPGRSKTRLTPPCTPQEAADLAEAALADTLRAALGSGADRVVLGLDGAPGPWCPAGVVIVDQGPGDLSERLERLWSTTGGPALQIGMDTPQADARLLDQAMAELLHDDLDAVLGLADDGGWWAIGLRSPQPGTFLGIATSRSDTGAHQRRRLAAMGLRTGLLPALRDVDRWSDAVAVAATAPRSRFAAAQRMVAARLAPVAAVSP